jgi:hypothetical protein
MLKELLQVQVREVVQTYVILIQLITLIHLMHLNNLIILELSSLFMEREDPLNQNERDLLYQAFLKLKQSKLNLILKFKDKCFIEVMKYMLFMYRVGNIFQV